MRSRLLLGILLPVLALVAFNAVSLYRQALRAADTAYDRTLLASAKSIGELLSVTGERGAPQLRAAVPYSALEAFEADNRSRTYFKVSGFAGEMVSGFEDLPTWRGRLPDRGIYAALVDFYDDRFRGEPVRVAVLLQPVAGQAGQGMATIQVAETLELRRTLARQLLVDTLWRQAALVLVIAGVVIWVVQRATRPVHALSAAIKARDPDDVSPIDAPTAPRELMPLIDATNDAMARVASLVAHQRRFVRDASHQLRTPLAVLKTQVQSAQRGDVAPEVALLEIGQTIDGATQLANQMLALAKVEQLRQQGDPTPQDWAEVVRSVSLDLAPLVAEREIDFELDVVQPALVLGHEWALRELVRNLLHNAIRHVPRGGRLSVRLTAPGAEALLTVADNGPGLPAALRERLFQPFAAGPTSSGSGLGLAICRDIVQSLGGSLSLENRGTDGAVEGLNALVRLPLAAPVAGPHG
ncbi:sensor histidine kinase N-terminal domain-containing protein [Aquincola sp. S2]|uniref:histidine kinase n=1 Tax=Pseudaquabacterium terrae TaxID=2732868 RepID=A0ABX2EIW8_9BURK|nr:sensor histidine kinase [Aquabacterium terrae]NRF68558.1 sensor histidine kinase N-terminal domain-containing protein [Aquabacterium terrae]